MKILYLQIASVSGSGLTLDLDFLNVGSSSGAGSLDLEGLNLSEGLMSIGTDQSITISQTNPGARGSVNKIIVSFPGQNDNIPNLSSLSPADLGTLLTFEEDTFPPESPEVVGAAVVRNDPHEMYKTIDCQYRDSSHIGSLVIWKTGLDRHLDDQTSFLAHLCGQLHSKKLEIEKSLFETVQSHAPSSCLRTITPFPKQQVQGSLEATVCTSGRLSLRLKAKVHCDPIVFVRSNGGLLAKDKAETLAWNLPPKLVASENLKLPCFRGTALRPLNNKPPPGLLAFRGIDYTDIKKPIEFECFHGGRVFAVFSYMHNIFITKRTRDIRTQPAEMTPAEAEDVYDMGQQRAMVYCSHALRILTDNPLIRAFVDN